MDLVQKRLHYSAIDDRIENGEEIPGIEFVQIRMRWVGQIHQDHIKPDPWGDQFIGAQPGITKNCGNPGVGEGAPVELDERPVDAAGFFFMKKFRDEINEGFISYLILYLDEEWKWRMYSFMNIQMKI